MTTKQIKEGMLIIPDSLSIMPGPSSDAGSERTPGKTAPVVEGQSHLALEWSTAAEGEPVAHEEMDVEMAHVR